MWEVVRAKQKAHLVKRNFIFRIWVKLPLILEEEPRARLQRNTKHYDFSKNKSSTNFII
jgi:hypothetical protein